MGYQDVKPDQQAFAFDRMGSQHCTINTNNWTGGSVNLTGSTAHLWVAVPTPNQPVPFTATKLTPASGFTFTTTECFFDVTETDINSWGLGPGTYAGQILVSNDGGVTTDVLWKGVITVNPGWISNVF